jgi:hypothetical protein
MPLKKGCALISSAPAFVPRRFAGSRISSCEIKSCPGPIIHIRMFLLGHAKNKQITNVGTYWRMITHKPGATAKPRCHLQLTQPCKQHSMIAGHEQHNMGCVV